VKFLVDAQLPPALCGWLMYKGHEAIHVIDVGMIGAADREIANYAEQGNLILVSKDEDFLLLRLPDRFVLLWLRVGNATNRALTVWLQARWPTIVGMLTTGERLVEVR
jgi:predicted nuclease of predicted toxin-antitoxin system